MDTLFNLTAPYHPMGDQPQAIKTLVDGIENGRSRQTLLGATGTGKTFTIANIIQETQRPTLILAHNKTLAAQLYSEFKQFFPDNAVSYFVSYYDYYQPEAYIPRSDTYIEKTTQINDEIERMRHMATHALATRRDVIVVASVSAIYSLGDPERYGQAFVNFRVGESRQRTRVLRRLVDIYYERNDVDLKQGAFRVRGDVLEIRPLHSDNLFRVEFWGDLIERIVELDALTGELINELDEVTIHTARHFVLPYEDIELAIGSIEAELTERLAFLNERNLLVEAQRLEQRTRFDLEMLREMGYCNGSENYGRHFYGRPAGTPPWTLLDYFPDDYLLVVDESHMTIPQIRAMYNGDRGRKQTLVDFGFRLPSALDNRPLTFAEWEARAHQVIFTSATPAAYEFEQSEQIAEQLIRPTGLLDPIIKVLPVKGQIDNLLHEVNERIKRGERALITTLTKRMAEELSSYLNDAGIKVQYLHSDIDTFERVEILHDLRRGVYDVVVGINLLREGLDLPEVSLVVILDADKEGFLRSETALVQTIGRAARHASGQVIMYADRITNSMAAAIQETERRRAIQESYNQAHGIVPRTVEKAVEALIAQGERGKVVQETAVSEFTTPQEPAELFAIIEKLEQEMVTAAGALQFEKAAVLRDQIATLKENLEGLPV